jgi:glycosyltransferase involved in cell wall biosynthesis
MIQKKPDTDPPLMLYDFIRNSVFFNGFKLPFVLPGSTVQETDNESGPKHFDLMYVEGPGDIVESFRRWNKNEDVITETSRTFSSQVFEFCKSNHFNLLAISYFKEEKEIKTPQFTVKNLPKPNLGGGVLYHLSQIIYGLRLVAMAIRHRPKYLTLTSGVTYWFVLYPLKWFGIMIVPQLHNCFWPIGYRPTGLIKRLLLALDGWFFRRIANLSLCVSPEIQRQIEEISEKPCGPIFQFRAQFYRHDFNHPPPHLAHDNKPFNIVFAGRVEQNKGVFDLLDIAEQLRYDGITIEICGSGSALEKLQLDCQQRGLDNIVTIHGQLKRPQLLKAYARAHVVIVPTRSDFCEGLPQVIAEAILLGRPVITTRLSNALDVLGSAIIEAQPDNVDSYVHAIKRVASDSKYYESLINSCPSLREQFLDGKQGLTSALQHMLIYKL